MTVQAMVITKENQKQEKVPMNQRAIGLDCRVSTRDWAVCGRGRGVVLLLERGNGIGYTPSVARVKAAEGLV